MRLRRNPISTSMVTSSADPSPLEILPWLKTLPLAPEYHPTVAEFQDPIAYILKIEKEASTYGICKIVPPVPAPPRKTSIANLNRSFSARNGGGSKKAAATFSSRQQQIGFCPRKSRPAQKPVWQSGEQYTLQEFEAKAKQFEKSQLKRCGRKGNNGAFSPLEVETLFWKASADKPIMVEYANDMPGSGFAPLLLNNGSKKWREEDTCNVGDTAWNMRGVSRAKGSLLKFMKEEIPGVTSPMVYVGMMFSWFAWHVEDHELHSLNYMHIGAGKTWYGMPRDATLAFEEVVRVHGYGGEVNPLVTFAILGEKTTVISPEVLVGAGIPCCRLVQNAGDFVVTFPGSYHCGFSHGFNCGEAANIATPEWLKVAKEAAIRRASINYPPMVSHFQLLYELTLSLSSRIPLNYVTEPRSSRLKDKMKGEGEIIVKEHFVENISRNNNLLRILLGVGASCVVLPQNALESSSYTDAYSLSRIKFKPRLTLDFRSQNEVLKESSDSPSEDAMLESNVLHKRRSSCNKGNHVSVCQGNSRLIKCNKVQTVDLDPRPNIEKTDSLKESSHYNEGLLNQGLLSCVACGILSFACVAIIQPTDAAALHLMSADCSSFDKNSFRPRFGSGKASTCELTPDSGLKHVDSLDLSYYGRTQVSSRLVDLLPESVAQKCPSALDLLASAYRNSDSEEDIQDEELACNEDEPSLSTINAEKEETMSFNDPSCGYFSTTYKDASGISSNIHETSVNSNPIEPNKTTNDEEKNEYGKLEGCAGVPLPGGIAFDELNSDSLITETADFYQKDRKKESQQFDSSDLHVLPDACKPDASSGGNAVVMVQDDKLGSSFLNSSSGFMHSQDRDSSRMHVFCLEHAYEVEKQLRMIGGAHMMVLCHPGYPHLEAEAKSVAMELGSDYVWKDIHFKDATEEDHKRIKSALEDEEVVPSNSDWAVKMHVNLYYSSNLSKSPLYSKQLPYNAVIYKAFGRNSSGGSPKALKVFHRRRGRQKKVVVAGRWCGKVWMSNQVHPYLACKNETEEEHSEAFQLELADQETVEGDIDNSDQGAQNRSSFDNSNTTEKVSTGGKRKKTVSKSKAKKVKYDKPEKGTEVSPESSSRKAGRVLRERANRPSTPQHNDDEMIGCSKSSSDDDGKERPSTCLRRKPTKSDTLKRKKVNLEKQIKKKGKEASTKNMAAADEGFEYLCDMEGCTMSFSTKQELSLHKRNICPVKGCGKKFFSHKYLVQHRRVHMDDRPLKCPWKGCKMSFKWAWARTEHIRVHTGDRPYICMERGCGQTFRFVSDFSRHKRKTGHVSKKGRR